MKRALPILLLPLLLAVTSCERVQEALKKGASVAAAVSGEHVQAVSGEEYEAFVQQPDKLVVVDFFATWCGPCKQLAPVLDKVAGEFAETAAVGKVDVDEAKQLAVNLGVQSIPEVRFFRGGQMVHRFSGAIPESELRKKFQAYAPSPAELPADDASASDQPASPSEEAIQPMSKDWMPPGIERR